MISGFRKMEVPSRCTNRALSFLNVKINNKVNSQTSESTWLLVEGASRIKSLQEEDRFVYWIEGYCGRLLCKHGRGGKQKACWRFYTIDGKHTLLPLNIQKLKHSLVFKAIKKIFFSGTPSTHRRQSQHPRKQQRQQQPHQRPAAPHHSDLGRALR